MSVRRIAPREHELLALEGFLTDKFSTAHWRFVYGSVWRNVLLTEVVQAVLEHQQQYPDRPISGNSARLLEFRDQNLEWFGLSFTERLDRLIGQLQSLISFDQMARNKDQVDVVLETIRFRQIEAILKGFLRDKRVFVLIDHLDESWSTDNEQTCLLLCALIHEADRLNAELGQSLRIVIFLRSDVFDVVRLKDSEIDKRPQDVIQWNRLLLVELIARRIEHAKRLPDGNRGPEDHGMTSFVARSEKKTQSIIF